MESNFSLPQFFFIGPRLQVMKPMQMTSARKFVGGKNWDPFSDVNTKEFKGFSENIAMHLPSFPVQGTNKCNQEIVNEFKNTFLNSIL